MKSTSKLEIIVARRPWGRTSERVLEEVRSLVFAYNTPPPFETVAPRPSLDQVLQAVSEICSRQTQKSRKGMMNASWFKCDVKDGLVNIYHETPTQPDRLFFSIK